MTDAIATPTAHIDEIRINPVALRDVDKEGEKYQNLVKDISRRGLLQPVNVIEKVDDEGRYFLLIDGLHRYTACGDAGVEDVKINVLDIDEEEVIETQIAANLQKVETKPIEYTRALQRMMQMNPTMTIGDMAKKVSQSPSWVSARFSLLKLDEPIQELVDNGDICIANAVQLAKLPVEHQGEWLSQAQTESPAEFAPKVQARKKELDAAAREGRAAKEAEFEPKPRSRKLSEMKEELESGEAGEALEADGKISDAESFAAGIAWALHMDEDSVEAGRAKWEAQKMAREEAKNRAAAARAVLKQQEADAKAAAALAASELSEEDVLSEVEELKKAEAARAAAKAEAEAKAKEEEAADEEE